MGEELTIDSDDDRETMIDKYLLMDAATFEGFPDQLQVLADFVKQAYDAWREAERWRSVKDQ
jgi:hypothetical protein